MKLTPIEFSALVFLEGEVGEDVFYYNKSLALYWANRSSPIAQFASLEDLHSYLADNGYTIS